MRLRRRIERPAGPTEVEWKWLTAAPGHNPFLGFSPARDRIGALWREHGADVLELWGDNPPLELPHGHPAATNTNQEGQGC